MNPFALPGPEFLLFYLIFALITLVVLYVLRSTAEAGKPPRIDFSDPYLIAYLRGGHNEALRVATISLIDRGLLLASNDTLAVKKPGNVEVVRRPIEKALVKKFTKKGKATDIFADPLLKAACQEQEATLTRLGLLPDATIKQTRRFYLASVLILLGGVAGLKILLAWSRGHYNIWFLVILTVIFCIVAVKVATPFRTKRGNALLADLRNLFRSLKTRAATLPPGGATNEVALLAAVFGLGALPALTFPHAKQLYPQATSSSGSSCGSSCGSACGSSCGGGCGGGCGGCGG